LFFVVVRNLISRHPAKILESLNLRITDLLGNRGPDVPG
jgi:hypothetical protein